MENKKQLDILRSLTRETFSLFNECLSTREEERTEVWLQTMAIQSFLHQTVAESLLDAIQEGKEVDYDNLLTGLKKLLTLEEERDNLSPEEIKTRWDEIASTPHLKIDAPLFFNELASNPEGLIGVNKKYPQFFEQTSY